MSQADPKSEANDVSGSSHTNGALTTLESHAPLVPALNWFQGSPPRPEILSAKANPLELLHAVRRRWPLALGAGMAVGSIAAVLVWVLVPVKYEAFSLLKISGRAPAVLKENAEAGEVFEIYKRTQKQLLTSGLVLQAVVNQREIATLQTYKEHYDDPISWLKEQLIVDYPDDSEILRVALKARKSADAIKIVNEVVKSYLKEIVGKARDDRIKREAKLQEAWELKTKDYADKSKALYQLKIVHKISSTEAAQVKRKLAMDELNEAIFHRSQLANQLASNRMEIAIMKARKENPDDSRPDHAIEMELSKDSEIVQSKKMLAAAKRFLTAEINRSAKPDAPHIRTLRKEVEKFEEELEEQKATLRATLIETYADGPSNGSGSHPQSMTLPLLEKTREFLEETIATANKEVEDVGEKLKQLDSFSDQVEAKEEELHSLRKHVFDLRAQVDRASVEKLAEERIFLLDPASLASPSGDAMRKYIAVAFAGILGFGLVVLGVAFLEFQSRKVNAVEQVNDGLGIRVIGELPNVSGRAWRRIKGGKGPAVLKALIAERIDGTRTSLIHSAVVDPPRVVMVTSAEPREGKTTTATQLAASLARSGRRTLLIDADVRSPGAHHSFGMPQEPGLCELLRGEADREAVVQPTRTPNLWLLAAGRCDLRSVQALSTSFLGTTIAAMCVQFDYIVIDSGPVLKVADPLLVGQHVDAAIVSVLRDVSKIPNVYEACERLRSVGITVLGAVVNGVNDDVARHGVELLLAETTATTSTELAPAETT